MATELEGDLNLILTEKETKILPENIKKDVQIFGVTGTLEQGSGTEINNQDKTITENGAYTADEGYTGLGTVTVNISQEDLQEQLNAQDLVIQQLQEELAGKASGGEVKPNVFMQETEPTTKDGIWLKGNYQVDNIIATKDVFAGEEWNTAKMSSLKAIPYSINNSGAVSIGTTVYLFGATYVGYNTNAYKYDTLTDTYTKLTNIPSGYRSGGIALIGSDIYLLGGSENPTKNYKYNTLTDTYTQLTNIPYNFYDCATASIGTNIYLFSGEESKTSTYKYDTLTDTYTKLTNIPSSCPNCAVSAIGTDVYLFGGSDYSSRVKAFKYNTITDTYTRLADIPYEFYGGSVISVGGDDIYLFGGAGGSQMAYKYNVSTNSYTQLQNIPYASVDSSVVFDGLSIYLFGGSSDSTKVRVMTLTPNDYGNNNIVISQDAKNNETNIANYGIQNAKFYYDRVYYQDENGELLNTISTYNGNGTAWVKISGGEK